MEQESMERRSATRHRQLPGRNPDNRNVAANSFACFSWSAQRGCTKGGPTAVHPPSLSPATLVHITFCLSFPSKAMSNTSPVPVKHGGWLGQLSAPSTSHVCALRSVLGRSARTAPAAARRPLPSPDLWSC